MRRRIIAAVVLATGVAGGIWWFWPVLVHRVALGILALEKPAVGKAAPDFTLQDANATPVDLADFKGKVILLNFWATWCEPCQTEIPWFRRNGNRGVSLSSAFPWMKTAGKA